MWGRVTQSHVVAATGFASATAADRQFAEDSRPIAGVCAIMATMQQVEQALSVLWTTQNAAERAQANDWLTAFQESSAAWEACASLLSAGSTDDTRLFGCTVLCNKLRRGCELPPAEQGALRRRLEREEQLRSSAEAKHAASAE